MEQYLPLTTDDSNIIDKNIIGALDYKVYFVHHLQVHFPNIAIVILVI